MRKKVWTLTPFFIIFSVVMLFMAYNTSYYNKTLAIIQAVVALVATALIIALTIRFKRYIHKTVAKAFNDLKDVNQSYLERFKMPVVVVGKYGEILWSNSRFKKRLCSAKNPVNESISPFIANKNIDEIVDMEGLDVYCDGRQYTVYCTESDDSYVCFYIDNTYYKETLAKFTDTQKSVALISIDNYEDFANDGEEESARVILELESILSRFANENEALFKKLVSNKYMVIFDKIHLDREISKKFPILKEIRNIRYYQSEATISIGIGNGCETLVESEQQARKALDMALGRGGDQVAIMENGNYEFFGGVSAGVEKLSKVRTRIIATSIQRAITESDKVLIMGHRFADLDCVGAAVGLQPVIKKGFKKYCRIVIDKETAMATQLIDLVCQEEKDIFITPEEAEKELTAKTLLIVVDTHIPDFVQSTELLNKCKRVVVIDHHRKMVNFIDDSLVFFHEPMSSSASEMVTELITYIGENYVSKLQANALLAGIMLDTKNFVVRTGVRTFEAAAFLKKNGANTVETRALFANNIDTYKEKYKIICNAEVINNCAISVFDEEQENIRIVAAQAADELLSVADVSASFVIFKTDNNIINISSRSYGKLNVQRVMEKMGGGGHQNMAATQIKNVTIEQAKNQLLESIDEVYEEMKSDNI